MLTGKFARVCDDGLGESHEKGLKFWWEFCGIWRGFARFIDLLKAIWRMNEDGGTGLRAAGVTLVAY